MTIGRPRKVQRTRVPSVVDLFAGGGGASLGIAQALGVSPALAVNHDRAAIAMHQRNHPATVHLCEDLYRVTPFRPNKRPIDLLWGSPDCTHHSRAKGGKPVENKRRMLAWVILEWARAVHPTVIVVENVPEFREWGPIGPDDKPIKARRGETFAEFVQGLVMAGYKVEHRVLNAAHYGAPTSRRRLFLIARNDGKPIAWPTPTHGPGRIPYRTAAECIDWTVPMLSIFASPAEARVWARQTGMGLPKRPLADATQRRIAEGVRRFVLRGQPFVVSIDHQSTGSSAVRGADEPLSTATTKARHALVAPTLIQVGYGERQGQAPRVLDLERPLGTVVAGGPKHALVCAFLAKHNGGEIGAIGQSVTGPLHTITCTNNKSLVTVALERAPAPGRGNHVAAFLTKFYGEGGQHQRLDEPLHTIRTHDCFGLVTVELDGETYAIVDIGMRMLTPRELARAQGFGDDYVLTGSRRDQVARIGNSVPPPVARAIVETLFDMPSAEREAA